MADGTSNKENLDNQCSNGEEKVPLFGPPIRVQPTPESEALERIFGNFEEALPFLRAESLGVIPLSRLHSHSNELQGKPQPRVELEKRNSTDPKASTNKQGPSQETVTDSKFQDISSLPVESAQLGVKSPPSTALEDRSNGNSGSTNKED